MSNSPKENSNNFDEKDDSNKINLIDEELKTIPSTVSNNSSDQENVSLDSRKKKHSSKCKSNQQVHSHQFPYLHTHHHHHHQNNQKNLREDDEKTDSRINNTENDSSIHQQLKLLVNTVEKKVDKYLENDSKHKYDAGQLNLGYQNGSVLSIYKTNQNNNVNNPNGGVTHTLTLSKSQNYPNHCHTHESVHSGIDKKARKKLIIASLLCLLFMIGEAVGGLLANSLAIATDAAHLLADFASFMISLFSIWMASRPATKKMSFGYYRAEVIGALTSVLLIWVVTGVLVLIAVQRLISGNYEIDAPIMLITAGVGVIFNIIMGISLQIGGVPHGHSHSHHSHSHGETGNFDESHGSSHSHVENLNVRAAFIHVVGDFIQSLGVLIAATIIYFKPNSQWIDPACTFFFSILVLFTTYHIIKDVINVLMEGIPKGIDFLEVQKTLFNIPGVIKVHNLRIWSLSLDKIALSAHLAIGKNQDPRYVLRKASKLIKEKFKIFDLTIQVEEYKDEMKDCTQCNPPNFINESTFLVKK